MNHLISVISLILITLFTMHFCIFILVNNIFQIFKIALTAIKIIQKGNILKMNVDILFIPRGSSMYYRYFKNLKVKRYS